MKEVVRGTRRSCRRSRPRGLAALLAVGGLLGFLLARASADELPSSDRFSADIRAVTVGGDGDWVGVVYGGADSKPIPYHLALGQLSSGRLWFLRDESVRQEQVAVGPGGTPVFYYAGDVEPYERTLVRLVRDGPNHWTRTIGVVEWAWWPVLSPNARYLAYSTRLGIGPAIVVRDLEKGGEALISAVGSSARMDRVTWAPDSSAVIWGTSREGWLWRLDDRRLSAPLPLGSYPWDLCPHWGQSRTDVFMFAGASAEPEPLIVRHVRVSDHEVREVWRREIPWWAIPRQRIGAWAYGAERMVVATTAGEDVRSGLYVYPGSEGAWERVAEAERGEIGVVLLDSRRVLFSADQRLWILDVGHLRVTPVTWREVGAGVVEEG